MTDGPRRSGRRAYVSLAALQERARAVATSEEQDTFWGDGANAEDIDDDESFDEKAESDAGEDVVDSDFDDPEDVEGNGEDAPPDATTAAETEIRLEERRASRRERTNRYVDPATKKRPAVASRITTNAKPSTPALVTRTTTLGVGEKTVTNPATRQQATTAVVVATAAAKMGTRPSLRKSTKAASARAAEERERRRAGEAKRRQQKALRNAEKEPVRPLTQAERLEAAKITEELNRDSLVDLLRMEEEKKRVPIVKRPKLDDVVSTRSRDGKWTVSFSEGVDAFQYMLPHASIKRQ